MKDNYLNIRVWSGVLVENNSKYLLVQEGDGKAYGQWSLPGGRVEQGHNLKETAIREAREEVGLEVGLGKELGVFHYSLEGPVAHVFHASVLGGVLNWAKDELLDAKWLNLDEVKTLKNSLRFPWIIDVIEDFEKNKF